MHRRLQPIIALGAEIAADDNAGPHKQAHKKPVIIKMRFPLLDTAARASLPTNFPTMMLSAVLYSC